MSPSRFPAGNTKAPELPSGESRRKVWLPNSALLNHNRGQLPGFGRRRDALQCFGIREVPCLCSIESVCECGVQVSPCKSYLLILSKVTVIRQISSYRGRYTDIASSLRRILVILSKQLGRIRAGSRSADDVISALRVVSFDCTGKDNSGDCCSCGGVVLLNQATLPSARSRGEMASRSPPSTCTSICGIQHRGVNRSQWEVGKLRIQAI